MIRTLFGVATGLSAVLCAIACVLWLATARTPRRVVLRRADGWYWAESHAGRLVVRLPARAEPLPPAVVATMPVERWLDGLDNRRTRLGHAEGGVWVDIYPNEDSDSIFPRYLKAVPHVVPRLLKDLEDHSRFAVAHVLLTYRFDPAAAEEELRRVGEGVEEFNGLRGHWEYRRPIPADPTQLPALRDYWHATLDRQVCVVRYARAVPALAALPALLLAARLAIRPRRSRRGECRVCGYNLSGNVSGICPECGRPVKGVA